MLGPTVVFLSTLNIILSIAATLGNALILVALHKESSLHPPTKLLFRCLAVTDLCAGLISQPFFAASLMLFATNAMNRKVIYFIGQVNTASSFIFCQVSVFTSTAISVDRLLALLLRLKYRHVVTSRRVRSVIICFWLVSVSCASMYFWNGNLTYIVAFSLITLSITTSAFSHAKIYLKLRHHQLQVHGSQGQPNGRRIPLNIARYKKSVSSVLWVQLALVACYVPFMVVRMVMQATASQGDGNTFGIVFFFTSTLTYLNSSLNPALYCWRIGTVRQAVKHTIKKLKC